MKKANLSIDLGGTHTRLRVEVLENGDVISTSQEFKKKVNSVAELENFIDLTVKKINFDLRSAKCVIGFAGAVIDHKKVQITNWMHKPTIILEELLQWGFPENNTIMVNDMELAGYGILDLEEKKMIDSVLCEALYKPDIPAKNRINNKLIIAPGTGFGTASILEVKTRKGKIIKEVLSSEIQHIQVPPLDERHAEIIAMILSQKPGRRFLNFEDFVSGKGLCELYQAIMKLAGKEQVEKDAFDIANSAINGKDKIAVETLNIYYKCTGRIIQAMALMIQPYGGIYLCGASTVQNAAFIKQSGLMEEFHNCLIRQQLLIQFPVYIISKLDINIAGGLWACRNIV
jgi:glucokinase